MNHGFKEQWELLFKKKGILHILFLHWEKLTKKDFTGRAELLLEKNSYRTLRLTE